MRLWLLVSILGGCEQVAPSGNPLEPVAVAVETSSVPPASGDASERVEPEEPEEELFSISSEELLALANGEEAASEKPETQPEPEVPEPVAEAPLPPQPAVEQPAAPPPNSGWSDALGKAWPVRLVTTVPNASPPRAILGLPDGREVVVNPGSMVPDMGLVVVAIAPNSAELARIAPAGDHATIETLTLRAQY